MAQILTLPVLGQTMEEGTILQWFKREGEEVRAGEPLYEVLTDKVNQEVEAPESGVLLKILAPVDSIVPIRGPVAVIGAAGEDIAPLLASAGGAAAPAAEVPAASSAPSGQAPPPSPAPQAPSASPVPEQLRISPRARRLAAERGVSAEALAGLGTGPEGRIVERDVLTYLQRARQERVRITPLAQRLAAEKGIEPRELIGSGPAGKVLRGDVRRALESAPSLLAPEDERIPYTGMRKVIGDNLARSVQTAPHVTLVMEVDMSEAARFRQQVNEEMERRGQGKLTFTDLIARATVLALQRHRALNATFDGSTILRHGAVHLGVAVSLDEGLIVPVIRNAQHLTLSEISAAVRDLASRAREGRLAPDEYQGGTFTITNLGAYGVFSFNPVINPPQCAILGVGGIAERPAVVEGRLEPRSLMNLCLSFDHRLVDGAPAAAFLRDLKGLLESPYRLLL